MALSLEVGQVFHVWCAACRPPKWKFYVLAQLEPRPRYFLINSNPAPFQREKPELMAHQITLSADDHPFLKRDSVLDCSDVLGGLTASELEDRFLDNPRVLLGTISPMARDAAREVIRCSLVLTGREIEQILASW